MQLTNESTFIQTKIDCPNRFDSYVCKTVRVNLVYFDFCCVLLHKTQFPTEVAYTPRDMFDALEK